MRILRVAPPAERTPARNRLWLSIPLCLVLCWAPPAIGQELSKAEAEVWQLEELYWQYLKKGNEAGYMGQWHADFLGWPISSDQPIDRSTVKEATAKFFDGTLTRVEYDLKAIGVRVFGKTAVIYAHCDWTEEDREGKKEEISVRYTHTWKKKGGKWWIVGGMSAVPES